MGKRFAAVIIKCAVLAVACSDKGISNGGFLLYLLQSGDRNSMRRVQ